ncbi:hypothetical protein [Amycolatopsis benzoatilytica]|uniref:hypothetical protein n=1 Tax=Amycolatopsis benzoatilytica TaxID=346045 RepID=UPI001B7FA730|nr:hypothetical protein [Amycolatopsis benzoatilytica]
MSRQAPPYRLAAADSVVAGPWQWLIDDVPVELPTALSDWDYRMDLPVRRQIRVDVDLVRRATGLPPSAKLTLAMVWTATGSGLKAAGSRIPLPETGTVEVKLDALLSGDQLGGVLELETSLVLAEYCDSGALASARRAGSVLWADHYSTRLQGDAPLFPIAVVDFSKTQYPEDAGWHLQVGGGLETATMGALLLLVNERKKVVVDALRNAAKPKPVDRVVLSTVHADVARTLVEYALHEPDFDLAADYGEDSMGSTLQSLIARLFAEQSVAHLRRTQQQSPATFATELQHAVRILEEN